MGRRRRKDDPRQLHGVLVLNKPSGPSSAECLERIKKACGQWTIGHAGTLDPLADGVLVVLLGQGTKLAPYLSGAAKIYRGALRLGLATDTYDITGQVVEKRGTEGIEEAAVRRAILDWNEITVQEVPAYSAAKHKGKPLYELARAGEETPVKTKAVQISGAQALSVEGSEVTFRVAVSAGTYVRSLVHSLGKRLGCGATMTALTREASLPFTLDEAHGLDAVLAAPDGLGTKVQGIADALLDWPKARLSAENAAKVRNGVRLPVSDDAAPGDRTLLLDENGKPLALAEAVPDGSRSGGLVWAVSRGLWSRP